MLADPTPSPLAHHWRQRDLQVLWHPCTQMREHPDTLPLVPIARGEGAWLIDHDGNRYLDAVSSWWTNLFGHAEPRIGGAIAAQATQLEQVMLAGFGHEPAITLAERLLALAPRQPGREPLAKVFYADNGSAGVEVALKMAFQYFQNLGESRRTRFIALENGYHGETLGALALGDIPLYRRVYAPLLAEALFAPSPDAYLAEPGQSAADRARQAADGLATLFDQHPGEICAVILEPRLQCAGGMRMHDPVYLQRVRELCDAHGAFMIADEIATGFGRTGTLFACEQAGVMPDLMCLSKGLTGGFLPLAAVLATQALYDAFLDDSRERAFLHSHSYTGNPLACAAALATLDIFRDDDVIARNRSIASVMGTLAAPFNDHPHVADVRQAGMVVAFELSRDGNKRTPFDPAMRLGLHAYKAALKRGVVLRPLGDVLYWMPPYCVDDEQLELLAHTTLAAIDEAIACA
ncbi:adenosylmethionine--8-amino-7-oxononanoate transaminase [Stenotrophomonas maltophilia]|uniref:adenosylmethionine--8-amino-7-oxononanoate transaminase n=1 Tax=Stenotrophomonas geniculata TaxID=86188 RepID=UPI001311D64E|nr:adenosylmethionine--8-amino-7-oxononanoate transaminase [Stenotrophomonas geniculata]MCI1076531.1 adenosylmethionine--8-amino-7-oxononanoate transaminase [Stenotrophomonas maltophilia]MCI1088830.1 adenosylmethionine--8-amino-7-oxononanoate transaminase [Stenotrophomonas maltophilia]MCI1117887.1 adenosylmethionine--8-amino-7-oxononanoate transaminase [Stenotrophomonas maltophilia]